MLLPAEDYMFFSWLSLFTSSCLAFVFVVILDLEDCIELHLEECMFFFWLSLFTSTFLAFVLFVILSTITSCMLMTVCIDSAVAAHFKLFASCLQAVLHLFCLFNCDLELLVELFILDRIS